MEFFSNRFSWLRSIEARYIVCFIYCFLVIIAPEERTPYQILIQNITFLMSVPQFYLVRAYLSSGPAQSKTTIHGMMISLTYAFQVLITYLHALSVFGYFGTVAQSFLQDYPNVFCVLATPGPIGIAISLYLMYLGVFRLFMAIDLQKYMAIDHDTVVRRVNISSVLLLVFNSLAEFWYRGTTCNSKIALKIINTRLGIEAKEDSLPRNTTLPSPLDSIASSVAIFCYILSLALIAIKEFKKSNSVNAVGHNKKILDATRSKVAPVSLSESETEKKLSQVEIQEMAPVVTKRTSSLPPDLPAIRITGTTKEPSDQSQTTTLPVLMMVKPQSPDTFSPKITDIKAKVPGKLKEHAFNYQKRKDVMMSRQKRFSLEDIRVKNSKQTYEVNIEQDENERPQSDIASKQRGHRSLEHAGQTERQETRRKLLIKSIFVLMFLAFFIINIYSSTHSKGIPKFILFKGYKLLFECIPMYWVLMVDNCYAVAKRRTITLLAQVFHVYLEE